MFKNAIAYAVTPGFRIDPELLQRRPARECGATESKTDGFIAPCAHSTAELVHHVAGYSLIAWLTEDKILPGSVVDEAVEEKVADIEAREARKVGRKERREVKELVMQELLPRAFSQKRRTFALLGGDYFIIDTSSPARAETMLESLRRVLDSLPLSELRTEKEPGISMAAWIASAEPPHYLTIDQDCVLEGVQEQKPQVKFTRTSIDADDVRSRVASGYMPKKLGLTYDNKVSFVLSDQMQLTRIQMLDTTTALEAHQEAEDVAAIFDADVTIAAGELIRLLDYLIAELGGLVKPNEGDLVDKAKD